METLSLQALAVGEARALGPSRVLPYLRVPFHLRSQAQGPAPRAVTLVTQASMDRLDRLEAQVRRGPCLDLH